MISITALILTIFLFFQIIYILQTREERSKKLKTAKVRNGQCHSCKDLVRYHDKKHLILYHFVIDFKCEN